MQLLDAGGGEDRPAGVAARVEVDDQRMRQVLGAREDPGGRDGGCRKRELGRDRGDSEPAVITLRKAVCLRCCKRRVRVPHVQRLEHVLIEISAEGLSGRDLDEQAEDLVVAVGVVEFRTWRADQRLSGKPSHAAFQRSGGDVVFEVVGVSGRRRQPAGLTQELPECDPS